MADPKDMYRCPVSNCGYVYDPDRATSAARFPLALALKTFPKTGPVPVCGASKKNFKPLERRLNP